ncbi:MAG: hypothetical protein Q8O22_05255 [Candidatus Omnitrophota bacterium]|nr:hypothetical protein [Candidatus Omnitrophota bacterium]
MPEPAGSRRFEVSVTHKRISVKTNKRPGGPARPLSPGRPSAPTAKSLFAARRFYPGSRKIIVFYAARPDILTRRDSFFVDAFQNYCIMVACKLFWPQSFLSQ